MKKEWFHTFRPDVEKLNAKKDVKGLINALKNRDSIIRSDAAKALGELRDSRAVEPLVLALQDESTLVSLNAVEALGKMGEAGFEPLVQALRHRDLNVRREAARNLGRTRDARAIRPLARLLLDKHGSVRLVAIQSLGEIGGEEAVRSLIELPLGFGYEDERETAVESLVRIGGIAVEPLIQALNDVNPYARSAASESLGKLGDPRAAEHLVPLLRDGNAAVRRSASTALIAMHSELAVEPLIQALEDKDREVRLEAAKALAEIGAPAVESLVPALKHADYQVRELAAQVLGEIKDTRAVEPLVRSLQDKYSQVVLAAIDSFSKIQDSRAVEPLTRVLKDGSEAVQRKAAAALLSMGRLEAADALVDWLFESGNPYAELLMFLSGEFFGDYTDCILRASASYTNKEATSSFQDSQKPEDEARIWEFQYDLRGSEEAIKRLCGTQTQISNNILHKVTQKRDVQIEKTRVETMPGVSTETTVLNLGSQREMAKKELERRGSPPYDASVYLQRDAWKIAH